MQYLLSQEEYESLRSVKRERSDEEKSKLQALCTLAAKHIPIQVAWISDGVAHPWGCVLDDAMSTPYCDECPAKTVCPNEFKEFSK